MSTDDTPRSETRYLWFVENLVDPACRAKPLGVYVPGEPFRWAPGMSPNHAHSALAEMLGNLDFLLAQGCRFGATGYGAGNIQEGRPFTPLDLAPGLYALLHTVTWRAAASTRGAGAWTWVQQEGGWTLYYGRGSASTGLDLLHASGADAFGAHGQEVRALVATTLNLLPLLIDALAASPPPLSPEDADTEQEPYPSPTSMAP